METEADNQASGGGWGWILIGLALGTLLSIKLYGGSDLPSNRGGDGSWNGNQQGQYAAPEPQYEPGSYGDFWAGERAAERGEPVKPSTGILPDPSVSVRREDPAKVRLADEVQRLRTENERLRRQTGEQ